MSRKYSYNNWKIKGKKELTFDYGRYFFLTGFRGCGIIKNNIK